MDPARHQPWVLHDFEPRVVVDLEPADAVTVTSLMDNVTDVFMPDQGPAKRVAPGFGKTRPSAVMEAGWVPEALLAEHGFSMLVTVGKDGSVTKATAMGGADPDFAGPGTEAAQQYKYTPYMRCGQAVEFQKVVLVPFIAGQPGQPAETPMPSSGPH